MGIKGMSANVIKQVWRDCSLSSLPRGTRIGVDGAGWLHKAVVANAADICLEKAGSHGHRAVFIRQLQQLLHAGMEVVVVEDHRAPDSTSMRGREHESMSERGA